MIEDELEGFEALARPTFAELWDNPPTKRGMTLEALDGVFVPAPFSNLTSCAPQARPFGEGGPQTAQPPSPVS